MDNRLYLIGDLWETTAHKPMDYYVDDKWPKKKLQISPYNLYEGWADVIAHRLDANIYYVLDNKMTFGGTLDMAMDTVSQVRDTDYDSINYYFINLPLMKGKLDLISPSDGRMGFLVIIFKVWFLSDIFGKYLDVGIFPEYFKKKFFTILSSFE